jgi:predicted permease
MHNVWADLRYAVRSLKRTPGFVAAAVTTIALGVGANTGIFSVINGVLFRDIPAPDADGLVAIYQSIQGVPERQGRVALLFSTREYETYRERSRSLSGLLAHSDSIAAMLGGEAPQQLPGVLVSCGYLGVLEQAPALGRDLTEADCRAGADPVVLLGYDLWVDRFGSDRTIVGRTVELDRRLFTVVGVAPPGVYSGMFRAAFFAPLTAQRFLIPGDSANSNAEASWLYLIGRRANGVSVGQVRAELGAFAAQIDREQPGRVTALTVERARPVTIPVFVRRNAIGASAVIMTAFSLVLLIACANVANLLLARGITRSREVAVRLALGSGRTRLIRQFLIESLLLSIAGGLLGSALALWSFKALLAVVLPALVPVGLPTLALEANFDLTVLAVTLLLTVATGVLCGLVPALRTSRVDLQAAMKNSASSGGDRRGSRLQATLIGAEVALCMVLMIGAGLLLRGMQSAQTIDPGFAYGNVTVLSYDYIEDTGHDPATDPAFWQRLLEGIRTLPAAEAAAYAMREPLGDDYGTVPVRLPSEAENQARLAELNWVSAEYFSVVELPLVLGRTFTATEVAEDDATVAIVSEATARNLWPGADPIGRTLLRRTRSGEDVPVRIVGVVGDAQVSTLGKIDPYFVYLPMRATEKLLVKSRGDYATTAAAIRGVVRALDPGLPAPIYPLAANLDRWQRISGIVTGIAASLGALALALAAVGIFGVVSYFVDRRVREIGIRAAMGARASNVLGLILRRTMRPVGIGAAFGVSGAMAASGVLSSVLFGVSPVDAVGLGSAVLFVLLVAVFAASLASRRAMRLDPMAALRED